MSRRIVIVVWSALALSFFTGVFALNPSESQYCKEDKLTKIEKCSTHYAPVTLAFETGHFLDKHEGAITAIFTTVLAFSTIFLWWATRTGIRNQVEDTRILQRAYLSAGIAGLHKFVTKEENGRKIFVAHIDFTNVGNLPAYKVYWCQMIKQSSSDKERNFSTEGLTFFGPNIIPPGTHMRQGSDRIDIDIEEGGWVYVWGMVKYKDGFGDPRFTKFCHRYNLVILDQVTGISAEFGRFHDSGNDAD